MKPKNIITVLSIGTIFGFIAGFVVSFKQLVFSFNQIITNKYIQYKMFRLITFNFQKALYEWMRLTIIVSFGLLIIWLLFFVYKKRGIDTFYFFMKYIRITALALVMFLVIPNLYIAIDNKITIPKGPNIILISIDTLRADHLGCYGYKINTSPYIDKFSKESVLFANARSQIHWTTPSHLSLFTSLYPSIFNVWKYPDAGRLDNSYLTLAEILRDYGYATAAFTASGFVHKKYGFDQGFDIYLDDEIKPGNITTIFNKFGIQWIKKQKRKFFVFLHCYEPHSPYNPPMPFKEKFTSKYTQISQLTERHYLIGDGSDIGKGAERWFKKSQDMNFLKTVIGLYDGEIRHVDCEIEKLFNELKKIGMFDNSVVIFLSDHGEAFNEHNSFSHGTLYDEILRVPLIIHLPKTLQQYNGKSINNVVSLVDVLPTILDICQIPYSSDKFQGTSFLNLVKNKGTFPRKFSFAERLPGWKSIATLQYKYMIRNYGKNNEKEELYDIVKNPGEKYNLLQAKIINKEVKKKYLQIKKILLEQIDKNTNFIKNIERETISVREVQLEEETKQRLKSLGYIQ